jgi:hypothetical protein
VRKISLASLACGWWLTAVGTTWAAESTTIDTSGGADYVFSYFLVLVCVGSGIAVVCSPSKRRDKSKPDSYSEKKLV